MTSTEEESVAIGHSDAATWGSRVGSSQMIITPHHSNFKEHIPKDYYCMYFDR